MAEGCARSPRIHSAPAPASCLSGKQQVNRMRMHVSVTEQVKKMRCLYVISETKRQQTQQTSAIISARKTSHKHNNKDLSSALKQNDRLSAFPLSVCSKSTTRRALISARKHTVTLTWHAGKCKVHNSTCGTHARGTRMCSHAR